MDEAEILRVAQEIRSDLESDPADGFQIDPSGAPFELLLAQTGERVLSPRIQVTTDWALSDSDPIDPEMRERLLLHADRGSRTGRRLSDILYATVKDAESRIPQDQSASPASSHVSAESLSRIADDLHVLPEELLESARLVLEEPIFAGTQDWLLEELTSAISLLQSSEETSR
jgi:hypothetical protein